MFPSIVKTLAAGKKWPNTTRRLPRLCGTDDGGRLFPTSGSRRVRPSELAAGPAEPAATVSVVIPCYNYARYLPACVESALAQEGVEVEVIIVDDASTDESAAVARSLATSDVRVRTAFHIKNAGIVGTFNDGLALARGEFLVRLDADDLLTPGSVARSVAVMQRFPSVGLVYGHPLHFSQEPLPRARTRVTGWTLWPGRTWLADRCRTGLNVITSPEVLMRRAVVDRVGGQMPLAHTHDFEMWLRIAAVSDVAYVHGADQAWHRDHPESISARGVDDYVDLKERNLAFEALFSGRVGGLPDVRALRDSARTAIAASALRHATVRFDRGADQAQVDRFIAFARSAMPDLARVPGWRGVQWRCELGCQEKWWLGYPVFFAARLKRRIESEIAWWRWHRSGVF